MMQEFSQVQTDNFVVPGMAVYDSQNMEVDSPKILSDNQDVDMGVGTEGFPKADQKSAAISQRCEFFELSPR